MCIFLLIKAYIRGRAGGAPEEWLRDVYSAFISASDLIANH